MESQMSLIIQTGDQGLSSLYLSDDLIVSL